MEREEREEREERVMLQARAHLLESEEERKIVNKKG